VKSLSPNDMMRTTEDVKNKKLTSFKRVKKNKSKKGWMVRF